MFIYREQSTSNSKDTKVTVYPRTVTSFVALHTFASDVSKRLLRIIERKKKTVMSRKFEKLAQLF